MNGVSPDQVCHVVVAEPGRCHTRQLDGGQAARFGLDQVKAPLPLRRWNIRAIAPQVALRDAGVA